MAVPPVPPPTWVRFTAAELAPNLPPTSKVDRYRIEEQRTIAGAPLAGLGSTLARLESTVEIPPGEGNLIGVLLHLGYTRAVERPELATTEVPGAAATCVLIPMSKSDAWWQLAQDERDALFRGAGKPGHVTVGLPFARTIVRKLYHCRALPGAGFDFLTYFEFLPARRAEFLELLAGLRDPERNPEWGYVERETEIWLSRV